jgi:hypothetical protein
MTIQKNGLRGCNPQVNSIPQLLREASGIQPSETVQNENRLFKIRTNEGTSSDPPGVNDARPLKVTKAERSKKQGSYTHALIFKPSGQKAKSSLWSRPSF